MDWTFWLEWFLKAVILALIILTGFAYLTLYERRALARIQTRIGPNRAGPQGLLQPIADAVKLMTKELILPTRANKGLFYIGLAPTMGFVRYSWVAASDKYAYLPAVGLVVVLSWLLQRLWEAGPSATAGRRQAQRRRALMEGGAAKV